MLGTEIVKAIDAFLAQCKQSRFFYLKGALQQSRNLEVEGDKRTVEGTIALGNLLVKDGRPPTVGTFGLRALPPGAVLEKVTMDAAERKKVIDGVDIDLKEYYVEPATAQQMNPRGRTWSRKRRKNSCAESVIKRFLLPWA